MHELYTTLVAESHDVASCSVRVFCTADFVKSVKSSMVYLCLCELVVLALQVCVVLPLQLHLVLKVSLHRHTYTVPEHAITQLLSLGYSLCPYLVCMLKPHAHTPKPALRVLILLN